MTSPTPQTTYLDLILVQTTQNMKNISTQLLYFIRHRIKTQILIIGPSSDVHLMLIKWILWNHKEPKFSWVASLSPLAAKSPFEGGDRQHTRLHFDFSDLNAIQTFLSTQTALTFKHKSNLVCCEIDFFWLRTDLVIGSTSYSLRFMMVWKKNAETQIELLNKILY